MSLAVADRVAAAVLYEGYMLYPYRPSSLKNQRRWTFGGLYPRESCRAGEPWSQQTECLVQGADARLTVRVRFLHLMPGAAAPDAAWPEAIEREVAAPVQSVDALQPGLEIPFTFGEPGEVEGARTVEGVVSLRAERLEAGAFRVTVVIENHTAGRFATEVERERRVLVAAHTLLNVEGGRFVSLLEPPDELQTAASACRNVGTWPVLVGAPGTTDTMLSSPIILYDYPAIAPESPGDFFDATEMDEMLTLRILTLSDEEKREMREADPRTRGLLERIEGLSPEARRRLHGAIREWKPAGAAVRGRTLRAGDHVRLKPRGRGDVFDIALDGRLATIAAVEQDFEGRVHLAVTVDDDPGRDLGDLGQPGHRFYFAPDDVEPL
jgi:hypothetical protein